MLTNTLRDNCRRLQEVTAPELSSAPLYIVGIEELDGLPFKRDCLGFALGGDSVNYAVRERLADRWQGPGRLIALDSNAISAAAVPGHFERCVLNVMLHELGHLVPPGPLGSDCSRQPSPPLVELHAKLFERSMNLPDPAIGSADDHHGPAWIRYTLHLFCRAAKAGFDVPLGGLLTQQSHAESYLPLVLGEAMRMVEQPFAEIAATPLPPGVADLHAADVRFHQQIYARQQ